MKKYEGTPIVHDYWYELKSHLIYAIVEWTEEEIKEKKSNLFLMTKEYHDYPKNI